MATVMFNSLYFFFSLIPKYAATILSDFMKIFVWPLSFKKLS